MFKLLSRISLVILKILRLISFGHMPQITSVCAIIQNERHEFLLQYRADGKGYCLPGGLTKVGEPVSAGVIREVKEETGIQIKEVKFLFYIDVSKTFPFSFTLVFQGEPIGLTTQNSWEGKAEWKRFETVRGSMAFGHEQLIIKFLDSLQISSGRVVESFLKTK